MGVVSYLRPKKHHDIREPFFGNQKAEKRKNNIKSELRGNRLT